MPYRAIKYHYQQNTCAYRQKHNEILSSVANRLNSLELVRQINVFVLRYPLPNLKWDTHEANPVTSNCEEHHYYIFAAATCSAQINKRESSSYFFQSWL
jgi:hypothetical protein